MGRHVPTVVTAINKHWVIILTVNSGYKNEIMYNYNFVMIFTTVVYSMIIRVNYSTRHLGIK
jgi:hypothetical protein